MAIITGETVYEQILSVDADNNLVTGATFDTSIYKNGQLNTAVTVSVSLSDISKSLFTAEWSASTTGSYQLYAKNNSTSVIFISDTVIITDVDKTATNVYVGL